MLHAQLRLAAGKMISMTDASINACWSTRRRSGAMPRAGGGNEAHEFIEVLVTQCVRSSRADKVTIEIDVVADDAPDRAIRRAVEDGIQTVSSHSTLQS
jgi:uncharacterized glyoxalase superfamily protein PhnB